MRYQEPALQQLIGDYNDPVERPSKTGVVRAMPGPTTAVGLPHPGGRARPGRWKSPACGAGTRPRSCVGRAAGRCRAGSSAPGPRPGPAAAPHAGAPRASGTKGPCPWCMVQSRTLQLRRTSTQRGVQTVHRSIRSAPSCHPSVSRRHPSAQ